MNRPRQNIVLIGMPGVGKSTVGVLLAKATGRQFVDTDVVIQARAGRRLDALIADRGLDGFLEIEQKVVAELAVESPSVIATGGSVVYSEPAMGILKDSGPVVHLELRLPDLTRRLEDLESRGVVIAPGQTLADLYAERTPLYRAWADLTVDCAGCNQDAIVAQICRRLGA